MARGRSSTAANNPSQQTGYFKYDVWNPVDGLEGGHITLDSARQTDIFCSSQVIMPETGSVFIAGGDNWITTTNSTNNQGNNNSNVFQSNQDGSLNTLTRTTSMNRARWYSSSTALVNGEIYIQGGNGGGDLPEVRQRNGNFRLLTGANTSGLTPTYPRNFLAPDGRVFGYDPDGRMYYVDTATARGRSRLAGQFLSSYAGWTSSAAMFRPGKILQTGRQLERLRRDRHHRAAAGREPRRRDVLEAAVGVGNGARRWSGPRDWWKSSGQHPERRQ